MSDETFAQVCWGCFEELQDGGSENLTPCEQPGCHFHFSKAQRIILKELKEPLRPTVVDLTNVRDFMDQGDDAIFQRVRGMLREQP